VEERPNRAPRRRLGSARWASGLALSVILLRWAAACGDADADDPAGSIEAGTDASSADSTLLADGFTSDDRHDSDDAAFDATAEEDANPPGVDSGASVLQFQNGPRRDGLYIEPAFTKATAAKMKIDESFDIPLDGAVYAQPLYIEPGPNGRPTLIVVTQLNVVHAIDAVTGATLWKRTLGTPATGVVGGCGFSPIGITGTPAIDFVRRTLYVDSAVGGGGPSGGTILSNHLLHALSIDDGSERPGGWPIDTSTIKSAVSNLPFIANAHNQRGGVLVHRNHVYFAYGSYTGSCGDYRGWVLEVPQDNPAAVKGVVVPWNAEGHAAGIWAPPGPSTDGQDIFVATGNGGDGTNNWVGGEAVLRLTTAPSFGFAFAPTPKTADFFAPSDWKALSTANQDLGASPAIPIDVPNTTPNKLVGAFGKNGVVYLLDRSNLGGIGTGNGETGEGVASLRAVNGFITGAVATYRAPDNSGTYVVVRGGSDGLACPGTPGDLVTLKIEPGPNARPTLKTAWCGYNVGAGSPIVTTTDGISTPIVWTFGWYGPYLKLFAFDGESGLMLLDGVFTPDASAAVHRWSVPIVVRGAIYGASLTHLYRFTPQP
jgi:hypothetical protein